MNIILALMGVLAVLAVWVWLKLCHARHEIDHLLKTTHELEQEKQQLQAQKAVAETQVQHFETRKKNEENSRHTDRTSLIERLQQQGDLRD